MNRPRGRWAMEPDRRAGVIGINMPGRSVEAVASTDGPFRNEPVPTEETDDPRRRRPQVPCRAKHDADLLQLTPRLGEARCVFFV